MWTNDQSIFFPFRNQIWFSEWCITQLSLIVHNKFPLSKVKTIWLGFPGRCYHFINFLITKFRQFINCFHWVHSRWHAKWHFKFVWFYKFVLEIMPFNHDELLDWFWSYSEVQCRANGIKMEKHRSEMVLNSSGLFLDWLTPVFFLLFDLKQCLTSWIMFIYVSDFKVNEFNFRLICLNWAEVTLCWNLQVSGLFDGYVRIHLNEF